MYDIYTVHNNTLLVIGACLSLMSCDSTTLYWGTAELLS